MKFRMVVTADTVAGYAEAKADLAKRHGIAIEEVDSRVHPLILTEGNSAFLAVLLHQVKDSENAPLVVREVAGEILTGFKCDRLFVDSEEEEAAPRVSKGRKRGRKRGSKKKQ